jgi:(E)-4-hydroxy-3-methyl-but-2-enyl pyrophosphate reductase
MDILLARTAGYCMGVKRAMQIVWNTRASTEGPVCTLGPIIHNSQVVTLLESRGVQVLSPDDELPRGATVIVRAHGISPRLSARLHERRNQVIDATCPRVAKIHRIIHENVASGNKILIVGDRCHPEILAFLGFAPNNATVISGPGDPHLDPAPDAEFCVVFQTTFSRRSYKETCRWLRRVAPQSRIYDTLCPAMRARREEVRSMAAGVEAMVVVGGRHSANTCRLAETARETGTPTFHVETAMELKPSIFESYGTVGVTAGASTPQWSIDAVVQRLKLAPHLPQSHQPPGPRYARFFIKWAQTGLGA